MSQYQRQNDVFDKGGDVPSGERKMERENDSVCRCKEVSKKSFSEMIRLMISDLAFWKKTKGQK